MKLLSKEDAVTKVNYFGIELLLVPERINYLATDEDGEVWAFVEEPVTDDAFWGDKDGIYLATVDLEGYNWKMTRRRICDIQVID